jgi:SAM-dependent methyltransferase
LYKFSIFAIQNKYEMTIPDPKMTKDPMGAAIYDYFKNGRSARLRVFSSQFEEDEIPVADLFRDFEQMPYLEKVALEMCQGQILDVGAGSGCHSVALGQMGKSATAMDISPLSVEVMRQRGVKALLADFYDDNFAGQYDTLLMLMNGSGIVGRVENFPRFFDRVRRLLRPGGCLLMDSSDLRYLWEDEDGSFAINLAGDYYGQLDYQMQYKNVKGDPFDWLYVDFQTLSYYAQQSGFKVELVAEGEHYDYLAKIVVNQ